MHRRKGKVENYFTLNLHLTYEYEKYILYTGLVASIVGGTTSFVLAQSNFTSYIRPAMVLQIGSNGNTLLRGTIEAVGTENLTVKSWGGNWIINISPSTKFVPSGDITQFKVGDFVGVQGSVNQNALWTIDATLVRNWTVKTTEFTKPLAKNWAGIASNIDVANRRFTLTVGGGEPISITEPISVAVYTINVSANARIVNKSFLTISLTDLRNGDTVHVWGPSETVCTNSVPPSCSNLITASAVRDLSLSAIMDFKKCDDGKTWGCRSISQGAAPPPGYSPPTGCGCIPTCPEGQVLITGLAGGTWPDGSNKGSFGCSLYPPA